jgi:hypothetical protein
VFLIRSNLYAIKLAKNTKIKDLTPAVDPSYTETMAYGSLLPYDGR